MILGKEFMSVRHRREQLDLIMSLLPKWNSVFQNVISPSLELL